MKRSPLKRGTSRLTTSKPLQAKTELRRTTPLRATAGPRVRSVAGVGSPTGQPKPKRAKVTPEERAARKAVKARSGGVCEGCGQAPAAEWAHRVRRDVGPWCPANGLHLCNDLTARAGRRGCHEWSSRVERAQGEALGWVLRTTQDYLTTPVQHARHGLVLLLPDGSITPVERSAA